MKKNRLFLSLLVGSLCFCLSLCGQSIHTGASFDLKTSSSGHVTYIARDSIRLSDSFRYRTANGSVFHGKIDPGLIFLPEDKKYMADNGNISGSFLWGAVVGNLAGALDVSPTGGAAYSVPIECPPGVNGMQPALSLVYNSQGGNGLVGMGWSIGGLSVISRTPRTFFHDGERSSLLWDSSSPLSLDGQRLIQMEVCADSIVYALESGVGRVVGYFLSERDSAFGPRYFKVYTKEGNILEYNGHGASSSWPSYNNNYSLAENGDDEVYNMGWPLTKIRDPHGNYVEFEYDKSPWKEEQDPNVAGSFVFYGNHRLSQVKYGGQDGRELGVILFHYQNGGSYLTHIAGIPSQGNSLLTKIEVKGFYNLLLDRYDLSYSSRDGNWFLRQIKRTARPDHLEATYYHPLKFEWSDYSYSFSNIYQTDVDIASSRSYQDHITNSNWEIEKIEKFFGDIDGDGVLDMATKVVYARSVSQTESERKYFWQVYKRDTDQYTFVTERHWDAAEKEINILLFDKDKDGQDEIYLTELTAIRRVSIVIKTYIYQDNDLSLVSTKAPVTLSGRLDTYRDFYVLPVDCKGNGDPELFFVSDGFVYAFSDSGMRNVVLGKNNSALYITDINGNGKQEFMHVYDGSDGRSSAARSGLASSVTPYEAGCEFLEYNNLTNQFERMAGVNSSVFHASDHIVVGDFNGDGCSDFLVREEGKTQNKIWISTHPLFGRDQRNVTFRHISSIADRSPILSPDSIFSPVKIVMDINQDGRADVISGCYYEEVLGSGDGASRSKYFEVKVYINRENGQTFSNEYTRKYAVTPSDFMSVQRSGKYDASCNKGIITGWAANQTYMKYLNVCAGQQFNKITKITDSFGNETAISYKYLNTGKWQLPGISKSPDRGSLTDVSFNLLSGLEVVDQVQSAESDLRYSFSDPLFHWSGSGFLGFGSVTCTDHTAFLVHHTENKLDSVHYCVLPYKTQLSSAREEVMQTTVQYNSVKDVDQGRFYVYTDSVYSTDGLKGVTVKTYYPLYDESLNPCCIETVYGDNISQKEMYTYTAAGSRFLNKVSCGKVVSTYGQDSVSRTDHYFYDPKGSILLHTRDSLDSHKIQTFYSGYDSYGNVGNITTKADNISRSKSYTYTFTGRFIQREIDHQLQDTVNYVYDEKWAFLNSKKTRQGTTYYQYDNFRRLIRTSYPDSIRSGHVLQWAVGEGPSGAKYRSYSQTSGSSPVIVWYDKSGRELRHESYGLDNKKILIDTQYEEITNRVRAVSEPYYEGESVVWGKEYYYDEFGRVDLESSPAGDTEYIYEGLTTTVTPPSGVSRSTTTNAAGWVVSEKTNGKEVKFTHYAGGRVKTATPDGGTAILMEYDLQGNRIKLVDPDAGTVHTRYDGWGQLIREEQYIHNAVTPVVTTYAYHPSGLLKEKVRGNESTNYEYDRYSRLQRVSLKDRSRNKTISQSYTYDEWDRMIQLKDSVEYGKIFITQNEYDKLGRIRKEIYPGGYYIVNKYDSYSNLKSVTDSEGNSLWAVNEMNAKGQFLRITKGNKETVFAYDDRGFPTSVSSPGILDMSYHFSEYGNLARRDDRISNHHEVFGYDEFNRLTSWDIGRNDRELENYDQRYKANQTLIDSKTGYGSGFSYGVNGSKPHALSSFTAEGAASFSDSLRITYTDFKKMKSIARGTTALTLTYGVDEQRIRSELNNSSGKQVRYYLGSYEEEIVNGKTRKIHYISGGDGLAAVYIRSSDEEDCLYYAYTDYQGSLLALTDANGTVKERYAYDPWGLRRNPSDWTQNDTRSDFIVNRGYTFHEHLPEFNLINMNGRMYDPGAGLFFSPDPYIQAPGNWLNYNRYSYALNNPFLYTDPSGEFLHLIIGAFVGGMINWLTSGEGFSWKGLGYFGIGALGGALGAGIGSGISSALYQGGSFSAGFFGSATAQTVGSSFITGGLIGGGSGLSSGLVVGLGNGLMTGPMDKAFAQGLIGGGLGLGSGFLTGGIWGGMDARRDGRDFMTGEKILSSTTLAETPNIQIVGQKGAANCLEAVTESVENSLGNPNYQQNTIRKIVAPGSDPQKDMMRDVAFMQEYYDTFGREIKQTPKKMKSVIYNMNEGGRIVINKDNHAMLVRNIKREVVSTVYSPKPITRNVINVMNPARGGSFKNISEKAILESLNIFSIY